MADINKEGKSARAPFDDAVENKNEVAPDIDPNKKPKRRSGLGFQVLMPFLLFLAAAIGVILLPALSIQARLSLLVFSISVILWSVTKLNPAYVALAALVTLVLAKGAPQEILFNSLASEVIWLMIGAFVLGEAVQTTGLANRLTALVLKRTRTVNGLFWQLTFALIPLTFFIPSTSGRAAVLLPVFNSISDAADDKRITRALSLLLPAVILVGTISTLIGAGSHLIANDLLEMQTGNRISFSQWILYGFPFGLIAAFFTCVVILRMFLNPTLRQKEIMVKEGTAKHIPFSGAEKKTMAIAGAMVLLWTTENIHEISIGVTAVAGAVVFMLPRFGVLTWKQGLKSISWNLIIFIGAALMLGQSLIDSGAAQYIIDHLFAFTGISTTQSETLLLVLLVLISLTSHIYITSHTARAAALVPGLLFLAHSLQLNPVAVLFIGTVGMDYCLTFTVSSKALMMFQESERETFRPADLLRLSGVMLIVHILLMLLFYFTFWRWFGLQLFH